MLFSRVSRSASWRKSFTRSTLSAPRVVLKMNRSLPLPPLRMSLPRPPDNLSLPRSEEHTSELQSQSNLVCRLLLEKKKQHNLTGTVDDVLHAARTHHLLHGVPLYVDRVESIREIFVPASLDLMRHPPAGPQRGGPV